MIAGQQLLSPKDPPPYAVVDGPSTSPLLFLCDHASNRIPESLGTFSWDGLLDKHIGYDIGAAIATHHLAQRFDAPAVLGNYSRLVADLNRFPADPTFAPEISDEIAIPANKALSPKSRQARVDGVFAPYHCRVAMQIDSHIQAGVTPVVFLIHSMTPQLNGLNSRDMDIDVMSMSDRRVAAAVLKAFSGDDNLVVTDNDPYELEDTDYTAIVHCQRRNLPHVQIEFRQDLIDSRENAVHWADILGDAIERSGVRSLAHDPTAETSCLPGVGND